MSSSTISSEAVILPSKNLSNAEPPSSKTRSEKRREKDEKSEEYLDYEDSIRDMFGFVALGMFIIIAFLFYKHTNTKNYYNKDFYDSCNAPAILPLTEILELNREIWGYKEDIEQFEETAENSLLNTEEALNLASIKKDLNESLETCNTQLKLRKPCYAKQINDINKMNQNIYKFVVRTYFVSFLIVTTYFFYCYKKLADLSFKNSFIISTLHTKSILFLVTISMALFGLLLLVQYGISNVSIEDVPVICGDATKYFYEECYYESQYCYSFTKVFESYLFQFPVELTIMFVAYLSLSIVCFLAHLRYHVV